MKRDVRRFLWSYKLLMEDFSSVILDHKLFMEGYEIHFALDYRLVHLLCFPAQAIRNTGFVDVRTGAKEMDVPKDDANLRTEEIRKKLAIAFLLHSRRHAQTPLMLPPHVHEMRSVLTRVIQSGKNAQASAEKLRKLACGLLSPGELESFRKWTEGDKTLTKKTVSIIKEKFPDLLYLSAGFAREAIAVLRSILLGKEPRILTRSPLFEHLQINQEMSSVREKHSHALLSELRPNHPVSNLIDAQAIEQALHINRELDREQKKSVLYLLSEGLNMERLLFSQCDEDLKEKYPSLDMVVPFKQRRPTGFEGVRNSVGRRLTAILLYMRFCNGEDNSSEDLKTTLRALEEKKNEFMSFGQVLAERDLEAIECDCTNRCETCNTEMIGRCLEIRNNIGNYFKNFEELFSWVAASHRFHYLQNYVDETAPSWKYKELDGLRSIALFLSGKTEALEKTLGEFENESEKELVKLVSAIDESLFPMGAASVARNYQWPASTRRLPVGLKVKNESTRRLLNELRSPGISKEKAIDAVQQMMKGAIEGADDELKRLLTGAIALALGRLEVVERASREIDGESLDTRREVALVRCMGLHLLAAEKRNEDAYRDALEFCERQCKKYRDTRFRFVRGLVKARGVICGLGLKVSDAVDAIGDISVILSDRNWEDIPARMVALNSLAYLQCMAFPAQREIVKEAEEHLTEMERLAPIERWEAGFLDTKGFVMFTRAQLSGDANQRLILAKAVDVMEMAKKRAEREILLSWERAAMERNLEKAKAELSKYSAGSQ